MSQHTMNFGARIADAVDRVVRSPDAPDALDGDFATYQTARSLRLARSAMLLGVVSMVFLIPTDFWTYSDTAIRNQVLAVRVGFAILSAAALIVSRSLRPRLALRMTLSYSVGLTAITFFFLGKQSHSEPTLIYNVMLVPLISVPLVLPGWQRLIGTTAAAFAALLFYALGSHELPTTFKSAVIYSLSGVGLSLALGGTLYRLERDSFEDRRRVRRHAREQEEMNHSKDVFLATVSHELRTPLGAIIGMADVLVDERLPTSARRHAQTIQSSGETLLSLVNDILDLAKIRAGRLELEHTPFSPREVIEKVAALIAVRCQKKGLDLSWYAPPDLPVVLGDASRLGQILLNLAGNAVKFTERGEIRIEAALTPSGRLEISVVDSGVGVPADKREYIFEEFSQADGETARRYGGTGLGLPIARRLARLMSGDVELRESSAGGSKFAVTLPAQVSRSGSPEALPEVIRERVVVYATNAFRRRHLVEELRGWKLDVVEAPDLVAAAAALLEKPSARCPICIIDAPDVDASTLTMSAVFPLMTNRLATCVVVLPPEGVTQAGPVFHELGVADTLLRPYTRAQLQELMLPLLSGASQRGPRASGPALALQPKVTGTSLRLLVVDDVEENRFVIEAFLANQGIELRFASDGATGLKAFEAQQFDVVLLDLSMPDRDGYAIVRDMRAAELRSGRTPTTIVAFTAHVTPEHETRAVTAGFTAFLRKPVRKKELHEFLSQYRERSQTPSIPSRVLPTPGGPGWPPELARLRPRYIENRRHEIDDLRQHTAMGNYDAIARLGHNMKSSGAQFSFHELATLGVELENAAISRNDAVLPDLINRIARAVEQAERQLSSSAAVA